MRLLPWPYYSTVTASDAFDRLREILNKTQVCPKHSTADHLPHTCLTPNAVWLHEFFQGNHVAFDDSLEDQLSAIAAVM